MHPESSCRSFFGSGIVTFRKVVADRFRRGTQCLKIVLESNAKQAAKLTLSKLFFRMGKSRDISTEINVRPCVVILGMSDLALRLPIAW